MHTPTITRDAHAIIMTTGTPEQRAVAMTATIKPTKAYHGKTLTPYEREIMDLTDMSQRASSRANTLDDAGKYKAAYDATVKAIECETSIIEQVQQHHATKPTHDTLYGIAYALTYSTLKLLGRGYKLKQPKLDGTTHAAANVYALRLSKAWTHDQSGIVNDLISNTYLMCLNYVERRYVMMTSRTDKDGKVTPTLVDSREFIGPHLSPLPEIDTKPIRDILNSVQAYLYNDAQKHYKRAFVPIKDEYGNVIGDTMYTSSMRAYDMSIERIEDDDVMQRLSLDLSERERQVVNLLVTPKQVLRTYSDNGTAAQAYVSRQRTLDDIAAETGMSRDQVHYLIAGLRKRLHIATDGNGGFVTTITPKNKVKLTDLYAQWA